MTQPLAFRPVAPGDAAALAALFAAIHARGDDRFFHPHPFDAATAQAIAGHAGKDVYAVATVGDAIAAYGMLRGWDEGYAVPSLGIATHPDNQGAGLGRALMHFLHATAWLRGAPKIRLKVYPENGRARALYESLGYVFGTVEGGQAMGILERASRKAAA